MGTISTPSVVAINSRLQRATEAGVRYWAMIQMYQQAKAIFGDAFNKEEARRA
jgi:hypothetical protein